MLNPMIDWTDERITAIICRFCHKVVPVARDSQLHKEETCDRCSRRVDAILHDAIVKGRA